MSLTRRRLFGVGSGLYGFFLGNPLRAQGRIGTSKRRFFEEASEVFAYGVASGDPLQDRVMLWTQVADRGLASVTVDWQAALDPRFENIIAEGREVTDDDQDYTLKIDAWLPFPGTTYYYRFQAHGVWSTIGRTRTAPTESDHLRIAVASCSSIWSGNFNAYGILAKRSDLDLIVHCGDYTYDVPDKDEERNMPLREIDKRMPMSLREHRQRYRYYRSDSQLRAAHQQHPWAIVWDNHDIDTCPDKEAAIQAFFEWIPVRAQPEKGRIYRSLDFGERLKIILLDTRNVGRKTLIPGTNAKSILGEAQFAWLKEELTASTAQWNVVVNQVLLSPFTALGKALSQDSWEAFPQDRDRLLKFLAEAGLVNTVVVTGDSHFSYACNLETKGRPVGIEFLPTSITRGNLDESLKPFLATLVKGAFEAGIRFFNPNTRYFESESHGYGLVDIKPEGVNLEFWYVDHKEQTDREICARSLYSQSGSNRYTIETSAPAPAKSKAPSLAPPEQRLYEKGSELGGQGGELFDGSERLGMLSRLKGLRFRSGDRVDLISCNYEDGTSWQVGGQGGKERTIELHDNEYIRSLSVGIGQHKKRTQVFYVKVTTSLGRILEGGTRTAEILNFNAPDGWHIVSVFGRAGTEVDKVGPIFAPDF